MVLAYWLVFNAAHYTVFYYITLYHIARNIITSCFISFILFRYFKLCCEIVYSQNHHACVSSVCLFSYLVAAVGLVVMLAICFFGFNSEIPVITFEI